MKGLYINKTNYVSMDSDEIEYLDHVIDGLSDDEIDGINTGCRDDSDPAPFRAFAKDIGIKL